MIMDLRTEALISEIKLNALLPDGMFEDDDIISFLNDAYFSEVIPFIMRHREDFYLTYTDFDPAASITIPSDAIAQKLKDVQIKRDANTFYSLPRLSMNEITSNRFVRRDGFYIQDNTIYFHPRAQTNTIRLIYFKRPYVLVDSNADTGTTKNYTISEIEKPPLQANAAVKLEDTTLIEYKVYAGTTLTITKVTPPFKSIDTVTPLESQINQSRIYIGEDEVDEVSVGDVLCPGGYSGVPKIPVEAKDFLVQSAILKAMIAIKDKDGYAIAKDIVKEAKSILSGLISPRIEDEVKKIVNTGPLWNGGNSRGWRK